VSASRNFRNDSAELSVPLHLAEYAIGENMAPAPNHGHRRFVTGRLDAENQ